jgi:hypothetical protein
MFCSTALATEVDSGTLVPIEVEGQEMTIYSEATDSLIDATVFIFDLETRAEASDEIYNSYAIFKTSRSANTSNWPYASRTITCYLNTGTILGLYNAFADITTGASGVQTLSARVRLYSQTKDNASVSNSAVADSGNVSESYSNYVWAEANASTSKTVHSAIATFSAYQPGYSTFVVSLKADVP